MNKKRQSQYGSDTGGDKLRMIYCELEVLVENKGVVE